MCDNQCTIRNVNKKRNAAKYVRDMHAGTQTNKPTETLITILHIPTED